MREETIPKTKIYYARLSYSNEPLVMLMNPNLEELQTSISNFTIIGYELIDIRTNLHNFPRI
jgi:hypothetical protein